ncbi:P-loop containing nucleoside triphosphate hydrolase protein [Crepidotus variabilis]|uniref:P-loop containing nucleoside triphosphate hydrolase protein n=1 Tax=Crepidotus variabilis TaxID=179855 RepID=A0A9P6JV07_9AGAR|nr:P-loop containing nucleoside triphosphate hydrolase protein [Crepidotus variabilis]
MSKFVSQTLILRSPYRNTCKRGYSSQSSSSEIVHIPSGSSIFAFGSPSQTKLPLIRDVDWTIKEGEAWAIISGAGGGKGVVFKTLLGHTRIEPPSTQSKHNWTDRGGLYPSLSSLSGDPYTRISHVSFRQRSGVDSGAFFDYTARYGAMREDEDRITLRQTLRPQNRVLSAQEESLLERLTSQMNLSSLLDLPLLTLSNGQTRRARIVRAILSHPELLLLDEPLTGLDVPSRARLNETLKMLHENASLRIIVGLRHGEEVPSWVSHILEVKDGRAFTTERSGLRQPFIAANNVVNFGVTPNNQQNETGNSVVELKNVSVAYGSRQILKDINWEVKQGDRWHLQGSNGSGKTTLLALLTGDHPQSFTQDHLLLPSPLSKEHALVLQPRSKTPTAHLRRVIGVSSPEMFDAFPRRHPGMSVWEAVGTGFDGGFVPRTKGADAQARKIGGIGWVDVSEEEVEFEASQGKTKEEIQQWRVKRCWEVLECLGPASWTTSASLNLDPSESTLAFASQSFSSLSPGEQRVVLLMRALVNRPPLVLLDEAWSGMDETLIGAARRYLRGEIKLKGKGGSALKIRGVDDAQAVVVITHWDEEVPWEANEVLKFRLPDRV